MKHWIAPLVIGAALGVVAIAGTPVHAQTNTDTNDPMLQGIDALERDDAARAAQLRADDAARWRELQREDAARDAQDQQQHQEWHDYYQRENEAAYDEQLYHEAPGTEYVPMPRCCDGEPAPSTSDPNTWP
jgi:hypothetical protein